MKDLAYVFYLTSLKTQWDLNHKGDYLSVIRWWHPTLVNGVRIYLNERIVIDQVNWLPKFQDTFDFKLEEGQKVEVIMGRPRCQIFIDGVLRGGEE